MDILAFLGEDAGF
jgi:hypothetical protein